MSQLFLKQQFFDNNGNILSGGKLYFYEPGTTTPKDTFSENTMSIANTNPVMLDARGEAKIFGWGKYDVKVTTSSDAEIYTLDGIVATSNYEYTSVRDFGAIGDGISDDTAAIQAAIDVGKAVYFPAGTYLTSQLIVTCPIFGEDSHTTILTRISGSSGSWIIVGNHGVSITQFYFDGSWVPERCVDIDGYSDCIVKNNYFTRVGSHVIHFNGADRLLVTENNVVNVTNGISNIMPVDSTDEAVSNDVIVSNNIITTVGGTAIQFAGEQSSTDSLRGWSFPLVQGGVIDSNTIRSCNGHGIIGQSWYLTISGNTIYDIGDAINEQGIVCQGRYISVTGNQVAGGSGTGIDMGFCYDSAVTGNTIKSQVQIGIEVNTCIRLSCTGNIVTDCGSWTTGSYASAGIFVHENTAVYTTGDSRDNVISNNVVGSTGSGGEYGISVGDAVGIVYNCVVSGNILVSSGTIKALNVYSTSLALVYGNITANSEEDYFVVQGPSPRLATRSDSGNTDFFMVPQGTGQLKVDKYMTTSSVPANFHNNNMAVASLPIKDTAGNVYYIPLATSTW